MGDAVAGQSASGDVRDPLDSYVTSIVTAHVPHGSVVRFSHAEAPHAFCARTAAVACGLGTLHPEAHIVVDGVGRFAKPPVGPWVSVRAVVVVGVEFAGVRREAPQPIPRGFGKVVMSGWQQMVAHRDALVVEGAKHPWRFVEEQIEYHYTQDVAVLRRGLEKALECRRVVVDSLKRCLRRVGNGGAKCSKRRLGVLLSGGIDSSALVEAVEDGARVVEGALQVALTVSIRGAERQEETHDLPHANRVAKSLHGVLHEHVVVDLDDLLSPRILGWVASALCSFDPMELRNAVVMGVALRRAKELGCVAVLTGDGADELFGGYSFMHGLSDEGFRSQRQRITENMSFSTAKLGAALGIDVLQPYLDLEVRRFAMQCERCDLFAVGSRRDGDGLLHPVTEGKRVLRRAFADSVSSRRPKVPIESGSGSILLRLGYFDDRISEVEYGERVQQASMQYGVVLRDREHAVCFSALLEADCNLDLTRRTRGRYGQYQCKYCGFNLESATQDFCVTCGAWPAK